MSLATNGIQSTKWTTNSINLSENFTNDSNVLLSTSGLHLKIGLSTSSERLSTKSLKTFEPKTGASETATSKPTTKPDKGMIFTPILALIIVSSLLAFSALMGGIFVLIRHLTNKPEEDINLVT